MIEELEEIACVRFTETGTTIGDDGPDPVITAMDAKIDGPAVGRVPTRVAQQIDEDLRQPPSIADHADLATPSAHAQPLTTLLEQRNDERPYFVQDLEKIDKLGTQAESARQDRVRQQDVLDERLQPERSAVDVARRLPYAIW